MKSRFLDRVCRSSATARAMRQIWGDPSAAAWNDWRWQAAGALSDTAPLSGAPACPVSRAAELARVSGRYPFAVTPYYLSLCDLADRRDPILRQVLPDRREIEDRACRLDPLGERHFEAVPGLVHRYANRAVLLVTGACAARCRHCTRKNVLLDMAAPGRSGRGGRSAGLSARLQAVIAYLRGHPGIREVIVSGGDPLMLETAELDRILRALRAVRSVEVLRIGTRVPVVLPMRIDRVLCACLKSRRPLWVNTQFNHPREITPESEKACRMLQEAGLPVSNQAVLLRGVNDSFPVLASLCNSLQRAMVRPYYVFQCDRVRGTAHFRVGTAKAARLARRLRASLGGLSMPLFVADVPGKRSKIPLESGRACG